MLSKTLEAALIKAIREAKTYNHEFVTVEHMLYGLLHDELTAYIISECGGSVETLKHKLEAFFAAEIPTISGTTGGDPTQTIAFNRVLQRAVAHVQSCGKKAGGYRRRAGFHIFRSGIPRRLFSQLDWRRPDGGGSFYLSRAAGRAAEGTAAEDAAARARRPGKCSAKRRQGPG